MELIFKTKTYKSKVSKYATIYSNDPDQPTVKIHLTSTVYPEPDTALPYTLSPDKITLSQENKKNKIIFENVGDSKMLIEPVGGYLDGFKVDVKNDDPKPGQQSELKFEWADEFGKENMESSITFNVSGAEKGSYRFSVPVTLQGTDPTPPKTVSKPPTTGRKNPANTRETVKRQVKRPLRSVSKQPTPGQTSLKKTESPTQTDLKVPAEQSKTKEEISKEKKAVEDKSDATQNSEPSSDPDQ